MPSPVTQRPLQWKAQSLSQQDGPCFYDVALKAPAAQQDPLQSRLLCRIRLTVEVKVHHIITNKQRRQQLRERF